MDDNMRTELCVRTLEDACRGYPEMRSAIIHSDRGSQYTSEKYRTAIKNFDIKQSMNSDGGRCHDNARCESMWARMKNELFYLRGRKSENYTMEQSLNFELCKYHRMTNFSNNRIVIIALKM